MPAKGFLSKEQKEKLQKALTQSDRPEVRESLNAPVNE